jgi:hypothetical protein
VRVRRYLYSAEMRNHASSFLIGPRCCDIRKVMQARYSWPSVDRETSFVINADCFAAFAFAALSQLSSTKATCMWHPMCVKV